MTANQVEHSASKKTQMELITILATVIATILLLDVTSLRKGVDSRDGIGDDWARPTSA